MKETLLCRRFELARAANIPLETMEDSLFQHYTSCPRCQGIEELDQQLVASMRRTRSTFSGDARSRVMALVRHEAEQEFPTRRWVAPAFGGVLAAAAAIMIVMGWTRTPAVAFPTPTAPQSVPSRVADVVPVAGPHLAAGPATLHRPPGPPTMMGPRAALPNSVGVDRLVDAHRDREPTLGTLRGIDAVRLPAAMAEPLLQEPRAGLDDELAPRPAVAEATLYVAEPQAIELESDVLEALAEGHLVRLTRGPHHVTVSERDDRVFVMVATPSGVDDIASR